ncbi:MAG: type II toxin-antitoxin system RelE/ParE family toxin [Betaproteobacteria bacterium]|nr:type II toxin-antitoxin system RelE/ParE family toxin [Betaproteobacteria bacterium]
MAAYRLLIKASAAKEIEAVDGKADRRRVVERIQALAGDPRPQGAEKLAGHSDRYRARQGRYRVVYLIDDGRREITVFKIGRREEAYR